MVLCEKTGYLIFSVFFGNPIWPPAAILNLTSKVKFDCRNEFRRVKTFVNHILHYFLRLK